jgi:hypothetical protein
MAAEASTKLPRLATFLINVPDAECCCSRAMRQSRGGWQAALRALHVAAEVAVVAGELDTIKDDASA